MLEASALISGIWTFTRYPHHATPGTQTQADKPDLNVLVLTSSAVSSLQKNVIAAAINHHKADDSIISTKDNWFNNTNVLEIAVA